MWPLRGSEDKEVLLCVARVCSQSEASVACVDTESTIDAGGKSSESSIRVPSWKHSRPVSVRATANRSSSVMGMKVV